MRKTKVINVANGAHFLLRGSLFVKLKSSYTTIVTAYEIGRICRRAIDADTEVWELNQKDLLRYEGSQSEDFGRCQNL